MWLRALFERYAWEIVLSKEDKEYLAGKRLEAFALIAFGIITLGTIFLLVYDWEDDEVSKEYIFFMQEVGVE